MQNERFTRVLAAAVLHLKPRTVPYGRRHVVYGSDLGDLNLYKLPEQ